MSEGLVTVSAMSTVGPEQAMEDDGAASVVGALASRGGAGSVSTSGPATDGPDRWASYLPGPEPVPAYLTSRFAAQYRVIVDVLLAAQDRSLTGLSFDEIAAAVESDLTARLGPDLATDLLAPDQFLLDARMEQLTAWEVVTRWQDPARTGEDFLRRRDRYQLTPRAAALHAFWSQGFAEDDAADVTLAPRAIRERIEALENALTRGAYTDAATEFEQIATQHRAMARAARGWQRTLAHALAGRPDETKQALLAQTLAAYIAMWGEQVDVHSPAIAEALDRLAPRLTDAVWQACVRATLAEGADAGLVAQRVERWVETWRVLGAWFHGSDGQARRLRRQLRDLVAPWARNLGILMDAGGAVSRRSELFALAAAIERADDDGAAHRLWDVATGLFAARHLLLPAPNAEDHALRWAEAPPAPVTARFRTHGSRASTGRIARAADFSKGRDAARRERLETIAAQEEATAALRRRSGTRLATWPVLTDHELDLLLDLLGATRRSAPRPTDGIREAVTEDGRWRVRLTEPVSSEAGVAVLRSPTGALAVRDWLFDLDQA